MLRFSKLKTVGRAAALVLLLVALLGPWFADSHPATEERCRPPLIWMGDGRCACLASFLDFVKMYIIADQSWVSMLCLPLALPFLSTLLLLLMGERRWLWACHLTAWGLAAIFSLLFFFGGNLYTWGDGLAAMVATAVLVGEILIARRRFSREAQQLRR